MSKSGTQIKISGGTVEGEQEGSRAAGGATCAAVEEPRKHNFCRISTALVWSRAPRFDAQLRIVPLVPPFSDKYPGIFRGGEEEFLSSF